MMRTIREMLGNDERVWVYLDGRETWEKLVGMAVAEGFHFGELPAEKWAFGYVIAVHSNGNMGHLPMCVWSLSFANDTGSPRKVDLKRFIDNAADCTCKESHFKMRLYSH